MNTDDIIAIQQLEALVHHAVDHNDQSMFDLVFTKDARFDGRLCGGPLCEGMAEIVAFFAAGKPPHPPSHHMTNCYVYEKDGSIRVKMKWMAVNRENGQIVTGDNDDWVVRTANGWRVRERISMIRYPDSFTASNAA
jgi:hypothetical protein